MEWVWRRHHGLESAQAESDRTAGKDLSDCRILGNYGIPKDMLEDLRRMMKNVIKDVMQ